MENRKLAGFVIILAAAIFGTLAFVIWPTLYMTNEQVNSQTQHAAQDFYNWYITYDGDPLVDHAYRDSRYLSPEMKGFLDEFTRGEMSYDPVLCAQDRPTDIKISPPKVSGGQAILDVSTNFEGHGFSVEMVEVDGDWLIDKVNCAP